VPSRKGLHAAAIIPLVPASPPGSSSLPEGCSQQWIAPSSREDALCRGNREAVDLRKRSQRAGPALPSYLALHHAGFSVPPMLPPERWALTPPFHPCQTERAFRRRPAGFPARCHRALLGRRYILCGTFREQRHRLACATAPLALPGALPFTLKPQRTLKVYFVTGSCEPTTTVSGLSSRPAILR
jgi:hypothetical protein